jgi:hypothetical protein
MKSERSPSAIDNMMTDLLSRCRPVPVAIMASISLSFESLLKPKSRPRKRAAGIAVPK